MSDYSNALSGHAQPLETLRARVSSVQRSDKKMVAWVRALAEANEQHAHQLQSIFAKYAVSERDLGTLSAPWDAVASVAIAGATASATAARRLRSEVEQPLAHASSAYDRATGAIVADASFSPDGAAEVQAADLTRAAAIRDALVRLQTLLVDGAQAVQASAERASGTLLDFNPSDEPDSFVAQIVSGVAPAESAAPSRAHARGASQQTFVQHKPNRKASRMSLPDSTYSKERKSGLRAKVGSIFRKPKDKAERGSPAPERTPDVPEEQELGRSASVRRPTKPVATQAPDFGLRHEPYESDEDQPLSVARRGGERSERAEPSAERAGPAEILQPTRRDNSVSAPSPNGAPSGPTPAPTAPEPFSSKPTEPTEPSPFAPPSAPFAQPPSAAPITPTRDTFDSFAESPFESPFAHATASPSTQAPPGAPPSLPSVPPPRGGRKINSIYFAGAPAARESVIETDGVAPLAANSTGANGSTASLARSVSTRRSLQREITGPQTQQHPALPVVDGPAASVVESITATKRGSHFESVHLEGEIKFAANKAMQLQVINAKHLDSLVPSSSLTADATAAGIFGYDPAGHVPGAQIASYTGSFPALVPLVLTPQWQVQDKQTRLIITYQLAPEYVLESAVLLNFAVAVSVTGGLASSAHAKPLATFSREKQRVTWRFHQPVEVTKATPQRLVCQFLTEGPAHESSEGVEARFEIHNAPTAIGLQTFGESGWVPVKTSATAYTQKYIVKSQ